MGRISFLILFTLLFYFTYPLHAEGDISFDIKDGACWKATPQTISFLNMEGYIEKKRDSLYYFPNPRATLGNWPLKDITLSIDREQRQPNAFYISIYDSSKASTLLTMDIFTPMLMSLVQTLNANYQVNGRLSSDKTAYHWDTMDGSACLTFHTTKGADGKTTPQTLRLILAKRGYMNTARNGASDIFEGVIPSHNAKDNVTSPQKADKSSTPAARLSKAQLKEKVSSSPDSVYITGIPEISRSYGVPLQIYTTLAVLKHYGYPNIDNKTSEGLAKEAEDAVQISRQKSTSSRNEQEMDVVLKVLRNKYQIRSYFPERLTEGRDTGAIIKRCDREQKTAFTRSEYDTSLHTLFSFKEDTLIKVRSSLPANNERWFKTVKENIDQGIPLIWRVYDKHITTKLIIGYNPALKDIIYMDSNGDLAHISLEKAIAYSISQTIIYP